MPASASLRALLAGSIDYAGLFPPASLTLEPALKNYAEYLRSTEAWMLGAFVLPWGKFAAASASMTHFDVINRFRISALGSKTESATEFIATLESGASSILAFDAQHGAVAGVAQVEMALPTEPGVTLSSANTALAGLEVCTFLEAPPDEAERTIAFLGERSWSGAGKYGFKLRTGGVIASAFPSAVQIARALVAAAESRVPIKFTAGLHHPLRQFHASVQTRMHGFLNVLGAGVLAAEHRWDVQQTAAMLEDEDAASFVFDDEKFSWRDWTISAARIKAQRELITSLGSCSFDEPRDDLRALNLL